MATRVQVITSIERVFDLARDFTPGHNGSGPRTQMRRIKRQGFIDDAGYRLIPDFVLRPILPC